MVTVSSGESGPIKALLSHVVETLRPRGLVGRWAYVAAGIAAGGTAAAAWLIDNRMTEWALARSTTHATSQMELVLASRTQPLDFEPPHPPAKREQVTATLRPALERLRSQNSYLLIAEVFARDGTLIYSDLSSGDGRSGASAASPPLVAALEGQVGRSILPTTSADGARPSDTLEIFAPYVLEGRVVGAYRVIYGLGFLSSIRPLIWGIVVLGLLPLFLTLLALVRGAAGRIHRQQASQLRRALDKTVTVRRQHETEVKEALKNAELVGDVRQREVRFRSLVQNSSDVITVIDVDTTIRYQTPSVEQVLGYGPLELAGTKLTASLHPDDVPRALTFVADAAGRKKVTAPVEWR